MIYRYLNGSNPKAEKTIENIDQWLFDNFPEMNVYSAQMIIDLYDITELNNHSTIKLIDRYDYCQRWGVAPYDFEKQPKAWKEFDRLMEYCKMKYYKSKKKPSK